MSDIGKATRDFEDNVERADIWVNGGVGASYEAKGGEKVPSIKTLNGLADINIRKAEESAILAEEFAKIAEAASTSAQVGGGLFLTVIDGISSTNDGDLFNVLSPSDINYIDLYENRSGEAFFLKSYPSSEIVSKSFILIYENYIKSLRNSVFQYHYGFDSNYSLVITDAVGVNADFNINEYGSYKDDWGLLEFINSDDQIVFSIIDAIGVESDLSLNGEGKQESSSPISNSKIKVATYGSSTMSIMYEEFNRLLTDLGVGVVLKGGIGNSRCASILSRTAYFDEEISLSGNINKDTYTLVPATSWDMDKGMNWDYKLSNGLVINLRYNATEDSYEAISKNYNLNISSETTLSCVSTEGKDYDIFIINIGKNDLTASANTPEYVFEKTRQFTDKLFYDQKKYIVLNNFVNAGVSDTSNGKLKVNQCNAMLENYYGILMYDVQSYLMSDDVWTATGITPTDDDRIEQGKGNLAPSLTNDGSHLKRVVSDVVVNNVVEYMKEISLV